MFDISIHAAREGGDCIHDIISIFFTISIHAAREGGDASAYARSSSRTQFQSTPPVKAATKLSYLAIRGEGISIHAAREGGDKGVKMLQKILQISIHAAREGGDALKDFSSISWRISIHAAREGGDVVYCVCCRYCAIFQSTPPVKAATLCAVSGII